jgi:SAM-dependent methyltransferase
MNQLVRRAKRWMARLLKGGVKPRRHAGKLALPPHRRFLSDQPQRYEKFRKAAEEYVAKLPSLAWLNSKPLFYVPGADYNLFFTEMYQVLNLLEAMMIPAGGRVLEVGSGPGWVTEVLLGCGFDVDAIEPSTDMIDVARQRIANCFQHHQAANPPRVEFHACTLEECTLPDGSFDAILFHASLHHVIDEDKGLAQCFRMLRPLGVLGVSEAAWCPGERGLEEGLEREMREFGTLENPYTIEYLDYLLQKHGFDDVIRYYGVNGLFAAHMGSATVREVAQMGQLGSNTLTARKPGPTDGDPRLTTACPWVQTMGSIRVLELRFDPGTRAARLRVALQNTGKTTWLHRPGKPGHVRLGLRQGEPGAGRFREAPTRDSLPGAIAPKEKLEGEWLFHLPEAYQRGPWYLDLVNDTHYWFSSRGTVAVKVLSSSSP